MKAKYNITDRHIKIAISLLLILAIIMTYGQVKNFDFVGYDDQDYVTENSQIRKGLTVKGIAWAFTSFYSANWHPLTWISHMLDCELYGLNPMGHHWTNLIFHMLNAILLFLVLERMTGAIWRSAFVAALFALHPLHVESVAWVSERKDVLSTFFGLLSIAAYCRYVKKTSTKYYILTIVLLSIGLMAKPMLVTFPFLLLLLDFWPLNRFHHKDDVLLQSEKGDHFDFKGIQRLILEKIPFFIPVVLSCALTFFAQKSEGAVQALGGLSLKNRIANALVSYAKYVLKMFWPSKLAVFYPHPRDTLPAWQIVGAALLITCACFLALRAAKKYPYIVIGLFWYLGTLVPVIGFVQVGAQAMADRYTYIPLIGLYIIVAWGVLDLFRKWHYRKIYLSVFAILILSALTAKTFFQIRHWKNSITLFEHAIRVTENNYKAHNNLAIASEPIDLDRAIFHYKEALKINPKFATAHGNLGLALCRKGNYEEAVSYFAKALEINPQKTNTRMDLANVLFLQEKPEQAISQYREILNIDPENANAHYNLAYILSSQKKMDQAEYHYKETLKINPNHEEAHYHLGNIRLKQGNLKEAFAHFGESIKIKPDYVQAYNQLGIILLRQGKFNKAKVFFSKALQLDPGFSEARINLDILSNNRSSK
ncbi:MAG: tetratricopeptide repeat protein [Deltaproteobacteria bacterium]|jgi:tetratricopeptide (TPR) repeat protein|nr:tetratricopeptide repeat protein [Deltaproteobacteria bacterium]